MTAPASFQFDALARDLYRMGDRTRKSLRGQFSQLAAPLLSDARQRAGWSTRIPGAISTRPFTDMTRGRAGVELRVDLKKAPHARAYEGFGGDRVLRHPVFADASKPRSEWTWTEKNSRTRPFVMPAVRANEGRAAEACARAVEEAARACGFR